MRFASFEPKTVRRQRSSAAFDVDVAVAVAVRHCRRPSVKEHKAQLRRDSVGLKAPRNYEFHWYEKQKQQKQQQNCQRTVNIVNAYRKCHCTLTRYPYAATSHVIYDITIYDMHTARLPRYTLFVLRYSLFGVVCVHFLFDFHFVAPKLFRFLYLTVTLSISLSLAIYTLLLLPQL